MSPTRAILAASLIIVSGAALAAPDAARIVREGNGRGAAPCSSCHGAAGEGDAAAGRPALAGLPREYLAAQLMAFQHGERSEPTMTPMARALDAREVAALSVYYAAQPRTGDAELTDAQVPGAVLAREGDWSVGVPACFSCHGSAGQGVAPHMPPIVGQPYIYVRAQLDAFRMGTRHDDPLGLMRSIAARLDPEALDAVAHYLAGDLHE